MAMKHWECPKCEYKLKALGKDVYHRCPKTRKNEWLKEVEA